MGNGMNKIIPGLYLGNLRDAKDEEQLIENQITHILSIHDSARAIYPNKKYLCIPAADTPSQDLAQHFPQCIDFIHSGRLGGGAVLVHCLAGASRSVTVVVAYLMTVTNLNWRDSLLAVRAARQVANPNFGFQRQLQDFDAGGGLRRERRRLRQTYGSHDCPEAEANLKDLIDSFVAAGDLESGPTTVIGAVGSVKAPLDFDGVLVPAAGGGGGTGGGSMPASPHGTPRKRKARSSSRKFKSEIRRQKMRVASSTTDVAGLKEDGLAVKTKEHRRSKSQTAIVVGPRGLQPGEDRPREFEDGGDESSFDSSLDSTLDSSFEDPGRQEEFLQVVAQLESAYSRRAASSREDVSVGGAKSPRKRSSITYDDLNALGAAFRDPLRQKAPQVAASTDDLSLPSTKVSRVAERVNSSRDLRAGHSNASSRDLRAGHPNASSRDLRDKQPNIVFYFKPETVFDNNNDHDDEKENNDLIRISVTTDEGGRPTTDNARQHPLPWPSNNDNEIDPVVSWSSKNDNFVGRNEIPSVCDANGNQPPTICEDRISEKSSPIISSQSHVRRPLPQSISSFSNILEVSSPGSPPGVEGSGRDSPAAASAASAASAPGGLYAAASASFHALCSK